MTAETDLLPLPEDYDQNPAGNAEVQDYARACVSSATGALRAEVEALKRHGTLLSNIAYNLAQDDRLSDSSRWSLDDARKKWDTAIHPAAAQEGWQ